MLTHKCKAKLPAMVDFGIQVLSTALKLNRMLGLDSKCMLNHTCEAKQRAMVGFGIQVQA